MNGNQKYLNNSGAACPVCGSADISAEGSPDFDGTLATQCVRCCDCGSEWYDEYRLTGFSNLTRGDELTLPAGLMSFAQFSDTGHLASAGDVLEFAGGGTLRRIDGDRWGLDSLQRATVHGARPLMERILYERVYLPALGCKVDALERAVFMCRERLRLAATISNFENSTWDQEMLESVQGLAESSRVSLGSGRDAQRHLEHLQRVLDIVR